MDICWPSGRTMFHPSKVQVNEFLETDWPSLKSVLLKSEANPDEKHDLIDQVQVRAREEVERLFPIQKFLKVSQLADEKCLELK